MHWGRVGKLVGALLAIAFVAIQFVTVERTNPEVPPGSRITAPDDVLAILERACFDCHSYETDWPWYSYVAPVSWLVAYDVVEAREHLNFSTWDTRDAGWQARHVHEVWEEVEEGEMPLWFYSPLHPSAWLDDDDLAVLERWAGGVPGAAAAHDDH
jgi:hypothetical protein